MEGEDRVQMCEPLLEQLPMEVPTSVQNPMLAFLKGIEGFDSARAEACLVRLLDAHYDSVGLLKLVTKDDLLNDVGLKPGDALQMVSAAKGVDHRCCPESRQPLCESPEECKNKRARTAAPETWESERQDVVNQAAAKEDCRKESLII